MRYTLVQKNSRYDKIEVVVNYVAIVVVDLSLDPPRKEPVHKEYMIISREPPEIYDAEAEIVFLKTY